MDWEHIIVGSIVALPATLTGIAAIITAIRNGRKIEEVRKDLNGRLQQLIESKEKVAFDAGKRDPLARPDSPLSGPPHI